MQSSSSEARFLTTLIVTLILVGYSVPAISQQPVESISEQRNRGIQLYKQGDAKGAAKILAAVVKQDKSDSDAWYFLGLALVRDDDLRNARKAFETTVKLKPDFGVAHTGLAYTLMAAAKNGEAAREARRAIELNAVDPEAHYILGVLNLRSGRNAEAIREAELAIAQKPNLATAYLLKSQTLMAIEGEASAESSRVVRVHTNGPLTEAEREERRQRYRKSVASFAAAADALQTYLKLAPADNETAFWQEQLETLRAFSGNRQGTEPTFFSSEVTTKVRVLEKREPTYTERARSAGIAGTVILRAVFTSTGTVEHILVLRSLPGGLTEEAVRVAKQIKFTPATIDGKPISMIMELQYNFNFY
jgi:TonB family protein